MNVLQFFKIKICMEKDNISEDKICMKKLNCIYNIVANVNSLDIMHIFVK